MTVSCLFSIGVAEFLFHCFTRHGCCKIKITDQGREFVNKSNGLDERFNQTLQRQLKKFVDSEQKNWDQYLDAILFSYSPFLVYGRHPHLPIEFNMRPNSYPESHDMDSNLERNIECLKMQLMDEIVGRRDGHVSEDSSYKNIEGDNFDKTKCKTETQQSKDDSMQGKRGIESRAG
ncbi:hypothetical protein EMCRGX_G002149 [Ephydatia muelleri]